VCLDARAENVISISPLAQNLREAGDAGGVKKNSQPLCELLQLPRIPDERGNLTFLEENRHIPFGIRRVYYLYDVPGGAIRGGHAHKALHQLLIAVSGSFDVIVDNGKVAEKHTLNRSYQGLYIKPMLWREMENFSSGAVCLVIASDLYTPDDYYRDYSEFLRSRNMTYTAP
jgi:dTDP-4-dehydrorhamnose 3,5-epimerase-like enzyme